MSLQNEPAADGRPTLVIETGGTTFLTYFKSARVNASVSKVVYDRAFAAPIPIRIDGRKINTLHACPTHGEQSRGQTLLAVFLQECPNPKLSLPWREEKYSPVSRQIKAENIRDIGCGALLTVVSKFSMNEGSIRWSGAASGSVWQWIQSGVIIQTDRLPSQEGAISWAILLSADGLETDLTSFGLKVTPELLERQKAVMASLLQNLRSYRPRYAELVSATVLTGNAWELQVLSEVRAQAKEWSARPAADKRK